MSCLMSVYSLSLININTAAENTLYFMIIDPVFFHLMHYADLL